MLNKSLLAVAVFAACLPVCAAGPESQGRTETKAERDARMAWWRAAKFGMFIHWGVYSVPAGTYRGRKIPGIGEWIMNRGRIPVSVYKQYAKEFNPVKYDPDAWVRLARQAGMKYIVITSKHHDGFALFDSKVTDWDVVDATPYGKDLLKPLSEACRRHGLKLGFYYSQAQDWCHRGGAGNNWDKTQAGDMTEYITKIAVPQVKEILGNYGPIAILWWDTPKDMTEERAAMLYPLTGLQPGIITNNRLFRGAGGDFSTPEQHIPATGIPGRDWETCMTMNRTWGFKSYDHDWKSTEKLIRNLVDIASKGGNFLLNVGPTSLGEIPEPSIQRLREIGKWMDVNGESVYGTQPSPTARPRWGRVTRKALDGGDTRLYLHVFDWPADGRLPVPVLNKPKACRLLADEARKFEVDSDEDGLTVVLKGEAPDAVCSVVVLDVAGQPQAAVLCLRQGKDGRVVMEAQDAEIHNPPRGTHARVESGYGKPNIGYWLDARTWVDWRFKLQEAGTYDVSAEVACPAEGVSFDLTVAEQKLSAKAPRTGDYAKFQTVRVGTVTINKPGMYTLAVRPDRKTWKPINLRSVQLTPKP